MGTALETVNRFYEAMNNRQGDGLADLVSKDIRFVGPLMQASGAEEFLALNAQILPFLAGMRMAAQFERDNDVCSIYEMDMTSPKGEHLTLTMADWIQVNDGRITEERIFFDPRRFAAAFEM